MSSQPLDNTPRRGGHIAAASLACLSAGLGEFLLLPAHPELSWDEGLFAALGLWASVGPVYLLLTMGTSGALRAYRAHRHLASEGMGASVALLLTAVFTGVSELVGYAVGWSQISLKNETLVPIVASSMTLLSSALGLFFAWRLLPWLRPILARIGTRWRSLVVAAICLICASWTLWPAATAFSTQYSPWPLILGLQGAVVALAFWTFGYANPVWVSVILCSAFIGVPIRAVQVLDQSEVMREVVEDSPGSLKWTLNGLRVLTDRDGDGFSTGFGSQDCNDNDPDVHPMAMDWPGNGIDEDCSGMDETEWVRQSRSPAVHYRRQDKAKKRWNFLVITVDALRPDRLGSYGYTRDTSPSIDAWAENSSVFERAYAAANSTRHSVAALFAGRAFSEIDLDRMGLYVRLGPGTQLIFERLQAAGYFTSAHLCAYLAKHFWHGIDRGIESFNAHEQIGLRDPWTAPVITQAAISTLDEQRAAADRRPWFMWVHYMEPHAPYVAHEDSPDWGNSPSDLYDGEIRAVDGEIGRLLNALEDRGLADKTVVILTSDHGEEFGEHGGTHHGKRLYEESIRVPLIIHVPGFPGARFSGPVSTIDIPETVANLAGIKPDLDYGARSLLGFIQGDVEGPIERSLFVDNIRHEDRQSARSLAMIEWPKKLILNVAKGSIRLFDLEKDPLEKTNLAREEAETARRMGARARSQLKAYQREEFLRLMDEHVLTSVPWPHEARPLAEGLELLRVELNKSTRSETHYTLELWYRATQKRRPNYVFRYTLGDETGRVLTHRTNRPLSDQYPTHLWTDGQIVHEVQVLKTKRPPSQVELRIKHGTKMVFDALILNQNVGP